MACQSLVTKADDRIEAFSPKPVQKWQWMKNYKANQAPWVLDQISEKTTRSSWSPCRKESEQMRQTQQVCVSRIWRTCQMPSETLKMEKPYHTNKPWRKSQFNDCTSWRFILIGSLTYTLSWEGRPGGSSWRLSTIIVSMVRKQAENEQEVVWGYRTPRFTPNNPLPNQWGSTL